LQRELSKKIKERKRYIRSPNPEGPKTTNVEMIDDLLERKPLMEFKGDLIFKAEDINKYIDLMPRPTVSDSNPIFHAGSTTNE
jgi:hypothetical protein